MSWWHRFTRGMLRHHALPEWAQALGKDAVPSIMEWQVTDHFHTKQGRSTGRLILDPVAGLLTHPQQISAARKPLVLYLKRHWSFSWWRRLAATLWPNRFWTPAAQEWENLAWARNHDVPVPEVLAMGEFIGPWLGLKSYLAIRELSGMLPLHEAIPLAARHLTPQAFLTWKKHLLRALVHTTRLMHEQDRFHQDLYLCHFFVAPPTPRDHVPGKLYVIDFHRLAHHSTFAWRYRIKDLAQLLYSTWSLPEISNADRWRFIHAYWQTARLSFPQRCLVQLIFWKAKRYARHNQVSVPAPTPHLAKAA
jgi:hypothetical protein